MILAAAVARWRIAAWPLVLAGAALLIPAVPGWAEALVYDRAAIGAGQWWRLASGNLVHFGAAHLALDVCALLVLGAVAQVRWTAARVAGRGVPSMGRLVIASAGAIGAVLFIAEPGLGRFGGLSGVVTAVLLAVLLEGWSCGDGHRYAWGIGLALVAFKLTAEILAGSTALVAATDAAFEAVPLSHLAGAATALLLCVRWRAVRPPARAAADRIDAYAA